MITTGRRAFLSLFGGFALAPRASSARSRGRTALYASVGPTLTHYTVDVPSATITRRGDITLPANVQYAWPHANCRFLYVASSDAMVGPGGRAGSSHYLNACRIAPTGELAFHGDPIRLPSRPIHLCTDIPSEHVLVAFNNPSALRVYRIGPDGTLAGEIPQSGRIDAGFYAHQVRVAPNNRFAILVTRGNDAARGRPEDPGALKVFRYDHGRLTNEVSVAPGGGLGFGPRHVDFHPSRPWLYVSRERENALSLFRMAGERILPEPVFTKSTLAAPSATRQQAGAVHVHPNGRFVYGVNRLDLAAIVPGAPLVAHGENSLVVFAINPATGEPTPVQHIDTGGVHDRTFHIDPTGRVLVTAPIRSVEVCDGAGVRTVTAGLTVFRIRRDGMLEHVRKVEIDAGDSQLFWSGMVALPAA